MHIVLLESGDAPGHCGVGDYTRELAKALPRANVRVSLLCAAGQPLADLRHRLAQMQADGLSIQYPARAFGASLKPHLLAYTAPCPVLITLHEYTQAHWLRRLSLQCLARSRRSRFVFTSRAERSAFLLGGAPATCVHQKLVAIASNIPSVPGTATREADTVVHFGLLRPDRGLEAFLQLAAMARLRKPGYRFQLIGAMPSADSIYARDRIAEARSLGVDVQLELPPEEVAALLVKSQFAYMPFPQGADERRGSLLAVLGNGVCTLTCSNGDSPPDLLSAVELVNTPEQALERIEQLRGSECAREGLSRAAIAYAQQFSWDEIARSYQALFRAQLHTEDPAAGSDD